MCCCAANIWPTKSEATPIKLCNFDSLPPIQHTYQVEIYSPRTRRRKRTTKKVLTKSVAVMVAKTVKLLELLSCCSFMGSICFFALQIRVIIVRGHPWYLVESCIISTETTSSNVLIEFICYRLQFACLLVVCFVITNNCGWSHGSVCGQSSKDL